MKVWYDACTGKHVRYGAAIAKRLRKSGNEIIFTAREHPDTLSLARILGETPIIVGKYSPQSLFSRLEESASRVIEFSKMFKESMPDVAISHQSVELCRTAFGLGIPIVLTADTPNALAVNRLTIPFAKVVIASEALPTHFLSSYCARSVIRFKGVDECAWIKGFKPRKVSGLKKPLIVIRQIETKACYAEGEPDLTSEIAKKLAPIGNIFFIKRYGNGEEFTVNDDLLDSANLVANADLVISAGGTLAREAALQGIPTLIVADIGRTYVNTYLSRKGFPLFSIAPHEIVKFAKKYIGQKFDVKEKLAELENPIESIEKAALVA
jgi:predicted glycosyltransferase